MPEIRKTSFTYGLGFLGLHRRPMIDSVCLLSVVCYSILCLRFSLLLPVSCVIVFFHGFIVGMNFLFSWGGGGGGGGGVDFTVEGAGI